ncbi:MAG: hypothetical protein AB7T59_07645 [Hyphomonadaceae bacterium]
MSNKWVDNEVYFGPNRRQGGLGKRWGDRRSYDDAGDPPPLSAVMRRLRVHLSNITEPDDSHHAYALASFAASEAERQHMPTCADPLREAVTLIGQGDYAGAEACVIHAQAAFNDPQVK